jgi:hypothetical protein
VTFSGITFILNFMRLGQLVQKLKYTQRDRQHDFIKPIFPFKGKKGLLKEIRFFTSLRKYIIFLIKFGINIFQELKLIGMSSHCVGFFRIFIHVSTVSLNRRVNLNKYKVSSRDLLDCDAV